MKLLKNLSLCAVFCIFFTICGENLLSDPSFESATGKKPGKSYRVDILKEWPGLLNSGSKRGRISLSADAYSGKQAVKITTIDKNGFNSLSNRKLISVSEGEVVTASVMFKGKGTGYIRVYFCDETGKSLKKYKMIGNPAKKEYSKLVLRFTVPAGVKKLRMALETLRDDADITFDDAVLSKIAKESYSEKFGARNMRRYIEKNVEDLLAGAVIENYQNRLIGIHFSVKDEKIKIECM